MKTETVNGTFELLGERLYCRTPYGLFPVAEGCLKANVIELIDAKVEVKVQNGVVIDYHFGEDFSDVNENQN